MPIAAFGLACFALGGCTGCFAMARRHASRWAGVTAEMRKMRDALSVVQIIDAEERRDGPITANIYQRAKAIHDLETRLDHNLGA